MNDRESWLNGWRRYGDEDTVWYGNGSHCVGCGKFTGNVVTIGVIGEVRPSPPEPNWPFKQETCPICAAKKTKLDSLPTNAVGLYKRVKELEAQLAALLRERTNV